MRESRFFVHASMPHIFVEKLLVLKNYKLFCKEHQDLVASGDELGHFVRIQRFVA